jgi:hypothetical protein
MNTNVDRCSLREVADGARLVGCASEGAKTG